MDNQPMSQWHEMNERQLRSLLDAQIDLREFAEKTARDSLQVLRKLAVSLCSNDVEAYQKKSPDGIDPLGPHELGEMIKRSVKKRLHRLADFEVADRDLGGMYEGAMDKIERLTQENAQLRRELAQSTHQREQQATRISVLEQSLEDAQRRLSEEGREGARALSPVITSDGPVPDAALPAWVQKWRRESSHERDVTLLRILAETGVARRSVAAEMFAERQGIQSTASGTVTRLFQRCERKRLIEHIEVKSETRGRATSFVRLTEQGRDVCRLLLGQVPVSSQATELLQRHKTAEHALLNLEAADLLRAAGYEVDLFPVQVELSNGRLFVPDLAVSRHGKMLFVEVERDTEKNDRRRKWENACDANGDALYVVVANERALAKIKSEILFWAGRRDLTLWMTGISDAQGKQGEAVWTFKRG